MTILKPIGLISAEHEPSPIEVQVILYYLADGCLLSFKIEFSVGGFILDDPLIPMLAFPEIPHQSFPQRESPIHTQGKSPPIGLLHVAFVQRLLNVSTTRRVWWIRGPADSIFTVPFYYFSPSTPA